MPTAKTTISRCGGTTPGITYPSLVLSSTGLLAYWRLGEVATPFADTSGRFPANPGDADRIVNGASYTTHVTGALPPGVDDGALQFNSGPALGDFLDVSNGGSGRYDFDSFSAHQSVVGWIKPNSSASTFTAAIISNLFSDPPTGWFLGIDYPSGNLFFERSESLTFKTVSSGGLTFGAWNHVAATYDGSSTGLLYINGALVATNSSFGVASDRWNNGPQIGGGFPHVGLHYYFPGVIDELALWDVTLSAAFIAQLASLGG